MMIDLQQIVTEVERNNYVTPDQLITPTVETAEPPYCRKEFRKTKIVIRSRLLLTYYLVL